MKISSEQKHNADPVHPIVKIDWRKTLLNLDEWKVYKFHCIGGMDYSRIISAASRLRRENVADFVINSDKSAYAYICKVIKH